MLVATWSYPGLDLSSVLLLHGLVYMVWSFVIVKFKIDDPLDAVAGMTIFQKFLMT